MTVFVAEPIPGLWEETGGEGTLDELIVGAWEDLAAYHLADCPICGGELQAVFGTQPRPLGGRCRSCGSKLA